MKQGALSLYVGNGVYQVEAIGSYDLVLPNGLVICLDNCHYAPSILRGVVSVHRLVENEFVQRFADFRILVSKNNVHYFNAIPSNGIYETDMHNLVPNVNSTYNVSTKREKHNLDSTYLWHCRLAHIIVARYGEFFKKNLITQEVSGRAIDLEEIQDEDTSPSEITSEIPIEVEGFEPPQEEDILIHRSERTCRAPNHLSINVEAEVHSLGDLNKPISYKATMLDSESNKWIDAMNAEIQSMMENIVWVLVDLPSMLAVDEKASSKVLLAMSAATESEYIAASEACDESCLDKEFISGLGYEPTINKPMGFLTINQSPHHFDNEPGVLKGITRHYHRDIICSLCALYATRRIRFHKVHTDDNQAIPLRRLTIKKSILNMLEHELSLASSFMKICV
ncbi:hypothetical protein Tco_1041955 [Tanacetum coccineum]|uniref:GAG-pre-integrase domain-containing protein n=1 Tax=Tanacetum coccineum TaxID=301880 RepID=A0ABQ5GHN2_9ASTR